MTGKSEINNILKVVALPTKLDEAVRPHQSSLSVDLFGRHKFHKCALRFAALIFLDFFTHGPGRRFVSLQGEGTAWPFDLGSTFIAVPPSIQALRYYIRVIFASGAVKPAEGALPASATCMNKSLSADLVKEASAAFEIDRLNVDGAYWIG